MSSENYQRASRTYQKKEEKKRTEFNKALVKWINHYFRELKSIPNEFEHEGKRYNIKVEEVDE